ncbi:MAG: hypothetical protein EBR73_16880 [Rhodobacteraceae bacterium]|nr:hypothetical protein [Paracoccaceae bacterium]
MPVTTRKHVSLQFKDAAGSPLTRTIGPGPGDFTFDGLEEGGVEALPVYNRGSFLELVAGDDKQISWSATIYSDGDQTGSTNTYTLNNCRTVAKFTESKEGNTWSFSGTCYQGITVG